jgi:hypothetical protein
MRGKELTHDIFCLYLSSVNARRRAVAFPRFLSRLSSLVSYSLSLSRPALQHPNGHFARSVFCPRFVSESRCEPEGEGVQKNARTACMFRTFRWNGGLNQGIDLDPVHPVVSPSLNSRHSGTLILESRGIRLLLCMLEVDPAPACCLNASTALGRGCRDGDNMADTRTQAIGFGRCVRGRR